MTAGSSKRLFFDETSRSRRTCSNSRRLTVEGVTISSRRDGVQSHTVRNFLTLGVDLRPGLLTRFLLPFPKRHPPPRSMMMCVVSPIAFGPTILSTDLILPTKGVLFLYVFNGISPCSNFNGTFRDARRLSWTCRQSWPFRDPNHTDRPCLSQPL